jgi:hypothetical protein
MESVFAESTFVKVIIFLVFGRYFENNHDFAETLPGLHLPTIEIQPRPY